ncbi:MAG: PorP/SprF family type IX secretion system membrane protein [Bacteroidota bacterium]
MRYDRSISQHNALHSIFKKFGLVLISSFSALASVAQVGAWSQYHLLPNVTNPASADSVTLVLVHFRRQAQVAGFSHTTAGLSFFKPLHLGSSRRRFASVNFTAQHDQSGANNLFQVSQMFGGFSYHLKLSTNQELSFGTQAGCLLGRIDVTKITTGNQFGPFGYDPGLPTGEAFVDGKAAALIINTGLVWNLIDTNGNPQACLGVAGYQVNRPNFSFTGGENVLPVRYLMHGGIRIFQQGGLAAIPTFRWIHEQGFNHLNVGCRLQFNNEKSHLLNEGSIALNTWYSLNNGLICSLDIVQPHYIIGLSYDLPIDSHATQQYMSGAFEVVIGWRTSSRVNDR